MAQPTPRDGDGAELVPAGGGDAANPHTSYMPGPPNDMPPPPDVPPPGDEVPPVDEVPPPPPAEPVDPEAAKAKKGSQWT